MRRKTIISFAAFTIFVCCLFAYNNPILLAHIDSEKFTAGEAFLPTDGHYDFGTFSLNSSDTENYTVKLADKGHVQLVDDTGNRTINVIQWAKMTNVERLYRKSFIDSELRKPSWMVDGACVHEIEFRNGDLYSACAKDTKTDTWIYLATPNEHDTAQMINSLRFNG